MNPSAHEQLAALCRDAAAAHHRAFAATNGDDPEWARWYAEYLAPKIGAPFGRAPDVAMLAALLRALDEAFRAAGGADEWPEFYARGLIELRGDIPPGG